MPGGRESPGRRPKENNARRAKEAGPQAQERTMPGGRRETFPKEARAAGPIKTFSVKKPRPEGEKNPFQKGPGPHGP